MRSPVVGDGFSEVALASKRVFYAEEGAAVGSG